MEARDWKEELRAEIRDNIRKTIPRLKRDGTVGMSVVCMMHNTPTPKGCYPVTLAGYEEHFRQVAREFSGFVYEKRES